MKRMAVIAVSALPFAQSTEPTSPMGNVEAVCQYVNSGISSYGDRFLKYKLPEECRVVRGIGEAALGAFNKSDLSCYRGVSRGLCAVQFASFAAAANCSSFLNLFFSLIQNCKNFSFSSSCVSFSNSKNAIFDPKAFCANSRLAVHTEGVGGAEEKLEVKGFEASALNDCVKIAETFNACQLVAVDVLGYDKNFCIDGSFSAYCKKYPTIVRDPTFKSICQNIVIPYLMESTRTEDAVRQVPSCTNIVQSYREMLQKRADSLGRKSAAASASLSSMEAAASVSKDIKTVNSELAKTAEQLDAQATEVVNAMKTAADQQKTMKTDLQDLLKGLTEATAAAEANLGALNYPQMTEDPDENMDRIAAAAAAAAPLLPQLKSCADIVNEILKKMGQPGYLAIGQAYGFVAIDTRTAAQLRDRLRRISSSLSPFCSFLNEEINKNESAPDADVEESFKQTAASFAELSQIYKRQIEILNSANRFGAKAQSLMTNAIQRIQ